MWPIVCCNRLLWQQQDFLAAAAEPGGIKRKFISAFVGSRGSARWLFAGPGDGTLATLLRPQRCCRETQASPSPFSPASSFFVASLCLIALPPPPEPHLPPPPMAFLYSHRPPLPPPPLQVKNTLGSGGWGQENLRISFQLLRARPPPRPRRGNMPTLLLHHFLPDKSVRPLTNAPPPPPPLKIGLPICRLQDLDSSSWGRKACFLPMLSPLRVRRSFFQRAQRDGQQQDGGEGPSAQQHLLFLLLPACTFPKRRFN